jgi:hypothetical protein
MVEGNLPGPLEGGVVLCRGAATNCYDMPSPTVQGLVEMRERKKDDELLALSSESERSLNTMFPPTLSPRA